MDQKYQELVTNQQNLMAADTPSRPASLTHQPSESKMPLQYHPVAVQSTVEFVMYIYIDVCVCVNVMSICCRDMKDQLAKLYVQCTQQDVLMNNLLCRARTLSDLFCIYWKELSKSMVRNPRFETTI